MKSNLRADLIALLKELRLPAIREGYEEIADRARRESLSYEQFLLELLRREAQLRRLNTVERLLRGSRLPLEKTLASFDLDRLPLGARHQIKVLVEGVFLDNRENLLVFGNPGSGKSHLVCAIARELIQQGRRVLFRPCDLLVQDLLAAKAELKLDKLLKRLSRFEAIVIDDIGYVQQSREEMEVLFTLLANRYERASVMLTSNLPFSKWEQIFKDPLTTAAAIDRLVHHSVILELNVPSYRMQQAQERVQSQRESRKLAQDDQPEA
jgi:DNA replication protein DnaC